MGSDGLGFNLLPGQRIPLRSLAGGAGRPAAASPRDAPAARPSLLLLSPALPLQDTRTADSTSFPPKTSLKIALLSPGMATARCEPWLPARWAAPGPPASPPAPRLLQRCPGSTMLLTFTELFLDPLPPGMISARCPPAWPPQRAGRRPRSAAGKPRRTQTFRKYALTRRNTIQGSLRGREPAMRAAPDLGAMNSLQPGLIERSLGIIFNESHARLGGELCNPPCRRLLLFSSREWHSGVALWQRTNAGMIFRGRNG